MTWQAAYNITTHEWTDGHCLRQCVEEQQISIRYEDPHRKRPLSPPHEWNLLVDRDEVFVDNESWEWGKSWIITGSIHRKASTYPELSEIYNRPPVNFGVRLSMVVAENGALTSSESPRKLCSKRLLTWLAKSERRNIMWMAILLIYKESKSYAQVRVWHRSLRRHVLHGNSVEEMAHQLHLSLAWSWTLRQKEW